MGIEKYRSKVNYSDILAGDRGGIATGLDASTFLRREAVPRTFSAPRVGVSGQSVGDTAASTDISAGSDDKLQIAVDGGAVVAVTLTLAGLSTGAAIEAELETQINTALQAAGQDARVWVNHVSGDDHYEITSQATGLSSGVVVTDGASDNVADDLKLGLPNGGTETAGSDDQDYLLYTTGGFKHGQPIEVNPHRTGRFHNGIIKKKKMAEFDLDTMINMSGDAGDSLDTAVRLVLESIFGSEEVVASQFIKYVQGLPNLFFSAVKIGTIHGEYFTGGYAKDLTLTVPGDAPGTIKYTGRAEKGSIAGIGRIDGIVAASTEVILDADHSKRFRNEGTNNPARVMVVAADGRTITKGFDGSLTLASTDHDLNKLILSEAIDAADDGFIVPWHPGAVQETGRDAIYTDLDGTLKLNASGSGICATNISLSIANDHIDFDNCFGADGNKGFVAGNKATMTLEVTADLSNENFADLVQAREFGGFSPEIIIGDAASGRYLKITAPKWIVEVPEIDLPENGTVPVTFTGVLYQSESGARDPISVEFR